MTRGSLVGVKGKARILRELLASETFAQEVSRLMVQPLDSKDAEVLPILADTNVSVSARGSPGGGERDCLLEERRERAGRGRGLRRG